MRSARIPMVVAVFLVACGGKLADVDDGAGRPAAPTGPIASSSSSSSSSSGSSSGAAGEDAGSAPRPKRTDLQLQALATAQCHGVPGCGISGTRVFVGVWGDEATCEAKMADDFATALSLRGVTVTQAEIDACTARQARTPCEDGIVECQFTGTLANGESCETNAQCQSGTCAVGGTEAARCGKCMPRAAAGESCAFDSECAIGLACNRVTRTCMSPLPAGAACVAEEDVCSAGLACLNGLCSERLPIGSACVSRGRIKYGYYDDCAGGSWCKSDTSVCTPFPKLGATAGIGESCGDGVLCRRSSCNQATKTCEPYEEPVDPPPFVCR